MNKLILLVGALALVAAACSGAAETVATVNGETITRSNVESLVRDAGDGFTNQDFATYLTVVIEWAAADQAASEEFGVSITQDQIDERVGELVATSPEGSTLEEYLVAVNATEDCLRRFAESLLVLEAVSEELTGDLEPITDDDIAKEIEAFPRDWTQVCVSHILVETLDEAKAVKDRIESGEDFAEVAKEVSIDTGTSKNGGDLGCAPAAQYVDAFAQATMTAVPGEVTDPIETEAGYQLILVADRIEAPADAVKDYLERTRAQERIDDWFTSTLEDADVTVAESVGTWVTEPEPQVLASN